VLFLFVGKWQEDFHISAVETPQPLNKLTLFADMESAVEYIVRPLIGFSKKAEILGASLSGTKILCLRFGNRSRLIFLY
jgi:hypothetical protein